MLCPKVSNEIMLEIIAVVLTAQLVGGVPGCHWDPLAPLFLQQEEEGALPWSFTLGEPSTVPNVLGFFERVINLLPSIDTKVGQSTIGCPTATFLQCSTTTLEPRNGLSFIQTRKAIVAGRSLCTSYQKTFTLKRTIVFIFDEISFNNIIQPDVKNGP